MLLKQIQRKRRKTARSEFPERAGRTSNERRSGRARNENGE